MHETWSAFYTWFVGGLTSGVILTRVIELLWNRRMQTTDRVRQKKDTIGQEFNKIFLEGKANGFREPSQDQDHFRKVILDIEKYDMSLSNKLALCRNRWALSALRTDKSAAQAAQLNPDLKQLEEWRLEADKLADEVYKEIKRRWTI